MVSIKKRGENFQLVGKKKEEEEKKTFFLHAREEKEAFQLGVLYFEAVCCTKLSCVAVFYHCSECMMQLLCDLKTSRVCMCVQMYVYVCVCVCVCVCMCMCV